MQTITTVTNVYSFDELNSEAQQKAIENNYEINVDYDWWQSTYEDAERIGLKITGFDIYRGSYCKGEFLLSACEVAQNIFNQHGEICETYKIAKSFMDEWQPIFNNYMDENHADYESSDSEDKMNELENEFTKSLCEDYRIILQKEFKYLTSKDAIIETIKSNDYQFTEDGKIF